MKGNFLRLRHHFHGKLFENPHRFFNADYRLAVLDMIADNHWIWMENAIG